MLQLLSFETLARVIPSVEDWRYAWRCLGDSLFCCFLRRWHCPTPTLGLATLSNAFIAYDGFGNVLEAYPTTGSTSAVLALTNNSFFTLTATPLPPSFSFVLIGLAATSLYWAWRRRTGSVNRPV